MRILVVCVPLREGIYLLVKPDLAAAIPWVTAIEQPSDLSTLVLPAVGGKFFFLGGGAEDSSSWENCCVKSASPVTSMKTLGALTKPRTMGPNVSVIVEGESAILALTFDDYF